MHPKLHEIIRPDLFDVNIDLEPYDACFFCLGVSAAGMSEADYTHLTYDLTLGWAQTLSPPSTPCSPCPPRPLATSLPPPASWPWTSDRPLVVIGDA